MVEKREEYFFDVTNAQTYGVTFSRAYFLDTVLPSLSLWLVAMYFFFACRVLHMHIHRKRSKSCEPVSRFRKTPQCLSSVTATAKRQRKSASAREFNASRVYRTCWHLYRIHVLVRLVVGHPHTLNLQKSHAARSPPHVPRCDHRCSRLQQLARGQGREQHCIAADCL